MKKLCLSIVLLASLSHAATAQEAAQGGARKIDECGDIQISDWLARADNFAIELQNAPAAKGYIVAYGVPNKFPGWPLRRAYQIKGYLIAGRGLQAERVEVVNGGYRDAVMFQLWVVESGAQLPLPPFDLGAALSRERTPLLFDRFYPHDTQPSTDIDAGYEGYLDAIKARFEPFAQALRSDPAARGCVIVYSSHRDRRGADRRLAARQKRQILTTHSLDPARVAALAGGRRNSRAVELWIVPPGSPLPKPTPTARPARRRRR
ncbi:MAG TPA: hypothetical protein VF064_07245 [Pyrinomonadaceae bacterium]